MSILIDIPLTENITQTSRPEIQADLEDGYTSLVLSGSSLTLYQTCKTKFYFGKVLRLRPNRADIQHMDRGTLVDWILAKYYNSILAKPNIDRLSLMQKIVLQGRIISTNLEFPEDKLEKVMSSFAQYIMYYTNDWEPIAAEQPFLVLLYINHDLKVKFYYEGKIDLIAQSANGMIIADHKSLETDRDKDGKNYIWSTPTNQTKGYASIRNTKYNYQ